MDTVDLCWASGDRDDGSTWSCQRRRQYGNGKPLRHGLCQGHRAEHRAGRPFTEGPRCQTPGCHRRAPHGVKCWRCRGAESGLCATDGCERPVERRGLCNGHLARAEGRVSPDKPIQRYAPSVAPEGTKWCAECGGFVNVDQFGKNAAYCKPCARAAAAKAKWGTTADELVALQGGKCGLCGTDSPGGQWGQWHIDHDHSCCGPSRGCPKCVRGALCHACNSQAVAWYESRRAEGLIPALPLFDTYLASRPLAA